MNQISEQPLILVADDDREFREELIPEALGRLNARVLKAKDLQEACLVAAEHDASSEDALELIVLDMHMPLHEDTKEIAANGGIQFLRGFDLSTCPVIVFTGYGSYRNCVGAAQAGAAAYLPKMTQDTFEGPEGGVDQLVETCRRLLEKPKVEADETRLPPDDDWLSRNYDWLCQEFGGRWIAFVHPVPTVKTGLAGTKHDGLLIVGDESQEKLRRTIVPELPRLGTIPPIVFVPKKGLDILD